MFETYRRCLSELPKDAHLETHSQEVRSILEHVGLNRKFWWDITGAAVLLTPDGADYQAVWLTEARYPFTLNAVYYSLPFWKSPDVDSDKLPAYWREVTYKE